MIVDIASVVFGWVMGSVITVLLLILWADNGRTVVEQFRDIHDETENGVGHVK